MRGALVCALAALSALAARAANPHRITPLADAGVVVSRSPRPQTTYCYTPGICRLASGRLVVTCDWGGPDVEKSGEPHGHVYLSDDGGRTWRESRGFPFWHARPFEAGGRLYVLGHAGRLRVVCSDDGGETWGEPVWLSEASEGTWHQSACNVWRTRGNVYLVMEREVPDPLGRSNGWGVNRLAPVLMRAREADDLTRRASWTLAQSFCFTDVFDGNRNPQFPYVGIPWYKSFTEYPGGRPAGAARGHPVGWLETNVVQLQDPDQEWFDPSGRTFHLFMRANTSGSGYAALAKVVERADGSMRTELERAPSGVPVLFVPMPGGQMRFHVLWDGRTRLYWLLSTQARDTMRRHDRLPKDRYGLPYNERQRLQLSFSRNMMDWCFAGLVAQGATTIESRHYAAMAVDGDDLCIVSRSGDAAAKSPHDTDLITFHRVRDFRSLVY